MLQEIGAKFSLKGIEEAISKLQQISPLMGRFKTETSGAASKVEADTSRMAKSYEKLASSIKSSMGMAKMAVGAVITGQAIKGVSEWAKGNEPMQKWMDNLRSQGATPKQLSEYVHELHGLQKRMPYVEGTEYMKTMSKDVVSMNGVDAVRENVQMNEALHYMARSLGPETGLDTTANIAKKFVESYAPSGSLDDKLRLVQKLTAMMKVAMDTTGARAEDLAVGLPYATAAYKAAGYTPEQMLAHQSVLAGPLGSQAGEAGKTMLGELAPGIAKLRVDLDKRAELRRLGVSSEGDLGEEQKRRFQKWLPRHEKRYEDEAEHQLKQNPEAYWNMLATVRQKLLDMGIDISHSWKKAFGEQAAKAVTETLDQRGRIKEVEGRLNAASFDDTKARIDASYQSLAAKHDMFTRSIDRATEATRKAASGIIGDILPDFQRVFDQLGDKREDKLKEYSDHLRAFVAGFRGAFSSAFGDLPNITGQINELIGALDKGNPEKWKQIGEDMGKAFGTNLGSFKKTLSGVLDDAHSLAQSLKTIAGAINTVSEFAGRYPNWLDRRRHAENVEKQQNPKGDWLDQTLDKYSPWGRVGLWGRLQQAGEPSPMLSGASSEKSDAQGFTRWTGPTAGNRPGFGGRPGWESSGGLSQPIQPMINVIVNNEFDGQQFKTDVKTEVKGELRSERQREADRMGGTTGSLFNTIPGL